MPTETSATFLDFALCYGSLAVTILGFIAFAWMTDGNARRTYLRRTDPNRPAQTPVITRVVDAETPAGARVTIKPADKPTAAAVIVVDAPAAAAEPPAAETPAGDKAE